ncbi:hypothetical protein KFK09_020054 [Dendrobium nobile]|uniref:Uncharacterized protein n=1 Tax=Dendrobium nobile TaxID=94219 RepID=A0A8T3ATX2_DENNO|nr:hypothetical protein KFK09_020054 [Dendrobium nobile]
MAWWEPHEQQEGSETELLRIAPADHQHSKLFVLCGDGFESSKVFRTGEFSARIIRVGGRRSVAMATCKVGDHQWMLAKDSMAVRVGDRAFVFALPGVLYGLSVPWECSDNVIRQLEEIFVSFCAYEDLVVRNGSNAWYQPESQIWTVAYEKLKNLAAQSSTKISGATSSAVKAPNSRGGGGGGCAFYDIASYKIQRAVRMSAAVKLASCALLSGALVPHDHLYVAFPPAPAAALPSVWALSSLLDAIESSGSTMAAVAPPRGRKVGFWWLRIEGVELLLDVMRAFGAAARKKPKLGKVSTSAEEDDRERATAAALGMEMRFGEGDREGWTKRRSWRCVDD